MRIPEPFFGAHQLGGRRLYAELHGQPRPGAPVVVIEVGSTQAGTKSQGWFPVRDVLARDAQVFLYDRAGLGGSDPAPLPRSIADFTADLHGLLHAAGVAPPYLLVGGSFGGLIVSHFAALHPQEVAGVVLEDSTHPEHDHRALALLPPESATESPALRDFRSLLWLETYAPLETNEWEGLDTPASIRQMRVAWDLGSLPLVVLTAGQDTWEEGFPIDVADRYEQLWLDLQKELAARSTNSIHKVIAESGHCIHADAPAALVDAVRSILNRGM
jgi:pimeloyl-ACP methyl ester carboxylesterase